MSLPNEGIVVGVAWRHVTPRTLLGRGAWGIHIPNGRPGLEAQVDEESRLSDRLEPFGLDGHG